MATSQILLMVRKYLLAPIDIEFCSNDIFLFLRTEMNNLNLVDGNILTLLNDQSLPFFLKNKGFTLVHRIFSKITGFVGVKQSKGFYFPVGDQLLLRPLTFRI